MKRLILRRLAAYLLDIALLAVVMTPVGLLLSLAYDNVRGETLWEILVFAGSLPAWAYFMLSDHKPDGATIGKRVFKIQVRMLAGQHLPWNKAAIRTFLKMLPWELCIFFVFALAQRDGSWGRLQTVGVTLSSLIVALYAVATLMSAGERSFYDFLIETRVRPARPPVPGTASPRRRGSKVLMAGRRPGKSSRR